MPDADWPEEGPGRDALLADWEVRWWWWWGDVWDRGPRCGLGRGGRCEGGKGEEGVEGREAEKGANERAEIKLEGTVLGDSQKAEDAERLQLDCSFTEGVLNCMRIKTAYGLGWEGKARNGQ